MKVTRLLVCVVSVVLALTLSACSNGGDPEEDNNKKKEDPEPKPLPVLSYVCSYGDVYGSACAEIYDATTDPITKLTIYCVNMMMFLGIGQAASITEKGCPKENVNVGPCNETDPTDGVGAIKAYYYGEIYEGETCASVLADEINF